LVVGIATLQERHRQPPTVGNVTTSLIVPDIGKANVLEMASHHRDVID
jgi:hypothetical protein